MKIIAPHFEFYTGQREEQGLFKTALEKEGIDYIPWEAEEGEIPEAEGVIWQGISDYYRKMERFEELLRQAGKRQVVSINSLFLTKWNAAKTYLQQLEEKGVPLLPTLWLERYDQQAIFDWMQKQDYSEIVIKPVISAGAYLTFRVSTGDLLQWAEVEAAYGQTVEQRLMVQPFAAEILKDGEYSFVFFGGVFSHAVCKTPKAGDYRIQHVHGGSYRRVYPEAGWLEKAEQVLHSLPEKPVYARVDGIFRNSDFILMEVELIEPYFYLDAAPENVVLFARSVKNALVAQQREAA